MKRSPLLLLIFLLMPPLMAEIDYISYCDPLQCLIPEDCSAPCGECECDFLSQISCETRRLYNSLDCEGKNRAMALAHCYSDQDCAVEQAAHEMFLRQKGLYPYLRDYEQDIEEQAGQNAYNRRFGY